MSAIADGGESKPPFVSVIVPVYNDPKGIRTTLRSLTRLTFPNDRYEVLVVDNGSTDETPSVVEAIAETNENVAMLVEREVQSSYAARNRGIEASSGEVLAFVDADMHVDADWLDRVTEELDRNGADYMGCAVDLYMPESGATLADLFDSLRGFDIERYVYDLEFAPTCCLVVRRDVVEDVGAFDPCLVSSGDLEFGNRVADAGYDLHYASDVTMHHPTRGSLRSNVRKAVRIGRGRLQISRNYPDRYGSPARRLLNPAGYLPPVPWMLRKTFRGWEALSGRQKLAVYLVATVMSFARSYGRVAEAVSGGTGDATRDGQADRSKPAD